jgi:hypothetical protein
MAKIMFNESLFLANIIHEYDIRSENEYYPDIFNIISSTFNNYSGFKEYRKIHYSHIHDFTSYIFLKICKLLEEREYSEADTESGE